MTSTRSLDECLASVEAEANRAACEPVLDSQFFLAVLGTLLRLLRMRSKYDTSATWIATQVDALCSLFSVQTSEGPRREWCQFAVYLIRATRLWAAKHVSITSAQLRRAARKETNVRLRGWICEVVPVADPEPERLTPLMCVMIVGSLLLIAMSAGTTRAWSLIQ